MRHAETLSFEYDSPEAANHAQAYAYLHLNTDLDDTTRLAAFTETVTKLHTTGWGATITIRDDLVDDIVTTLERYQKMLQRPGCLTEEIATVLTTHGAGSTTPRLAVYVIIDAQNISWMRVSDIYSRLLHEHAEKSTATPIDPAALKQLLDPVKHFHEPEQRETSIADAARTAAAVSR